MDYYTVSMAYENQAYLFEGMKNLKTLRLDEKKLYPDLNNSINLLGFNDFEVHRYLHLGNKSKAILKLSTSNENEKSYLVSANAKIIQSEFYSTGFSLQLDSHIPIKLKLHIPKNCKYSFTAKASDITKKGALVTFNYKYKKKVGLDVICKP